MQTHDTAKSLVALSVYPIYLDTSTKPCSETRIETFPIAIDYHVSIQWIILRIKWCDGDFGWIDLSRLLYSWCVLAAADLESEVLATFHILGRKPLRNSWLVQRSIPVGTESCASCNSRDQNRKSSQCSVRTTAWSYSAFEAYTRPFAYTRYRQRLTSFGCIQKPADIKYCRYNIMHGP